MDARTPISDKSRVPTTRIALQPRSQRTFLGTSRSSHRIDSSSGLRLIEKKMLRWTQRGILARGPSRQMP